MGTERLVRRFKHPRIISLGVENIEFRAYDGRRQRHIGIEPSQGRTVVVSVSDNCGARQPAVNIVIKENTSIYLYYIIFFQIKATRYYNHAMLRPRMNDAIKYFHCINMCIVNLTSTVRVQPS